MSPRVSRRQFVRAGAAAGVVAAVARPASAAQPAAPVAVSPASVPPVVVASANGHEYRNGGPRTAVEEAFARLVAGEDPLDAALAGVNILELDPLEEGVGYGGLPNADGVVQLDASLMHGPSGRAGGVACLEGVRTPSLVARAVADQTDHHLLVGRDARAFAQRLGFAVEDDLNTASSRAKWLEWKRRIDPEHWLDPAKRGEAGERARRDMVAEGRLHPEHHLGTIHLSALSPRGELAGVTTTSGLAFKIPGRVGDSPILGAGVYVDGAVGAAGSTGRGEANLLGLSSFLIVEELRRGKSPKDAAFEALRRIVARTREKRLLDERGRPSFNVSFYVLDRQGRFAGVVLLGSPRARFAVCTEKGPEIRPSDALFERALEG